MPVSVPDAIEAVIAAADTAMQPLDEVRFAGEISKAAPNPQSVGQEIWMGAFAEIAAWRFSPTVGNRDAEPWGLYWGPMGSGTLADGRPFYSPDVAEIDEAILLHWIDRATHLHHPILRARYADLSWEIGRYLKKPPDLRSECSAAQPTIEIPVSLARNAIDSYITAVESSLGEDEYHAWAYLERAISLSVSIRDSERTTRAKDALFQHYRARATNGEKFMWWRLFDIVDAQGKRLALTTPEEAEVTQSLYMALQRHADPHGNAFDPHQASDAGDRLAKRIGGNRQELQRITKMAGVAFESAAEKASGLLALSWLEGLLPKYRDAGLIDDVARIEQLIRSRAHEAQRDMKTVSVPVTIPKEELDAWADHLAGADLTQALARIGILCMMSEEKAKKTLIDMETKAPLVSMLPAALMTQDGFTEAVVNSVRDDLDGRALHHTAQRFSWEAPFLYSALNRTKEKHGLSTQGILEFLQRSPLFPQDREELLRAGLDAWLAEDPIKAIHVLVPQVEAACRDLLAALGASVRKPNPRTGGTQTISFGEILSHGRFKEGVPPDVRFHLRALYTDPRGINLRNHMAHGLLHKGLLGMGAANWVAHSILMLATLDFKQRPRGPEPLA